MHKFDPQSIERLLSEERRMAIAPEALLIKAGLKSGDVFADIGCGPGFFSIPAAKIVGDTGKVFAVDMQEEMLKRLKERNPPPSVVAIRSGESSVPLDDSTADFALLAYVLHEAADKSAFLNELKRIIKPGGALLVIDWKKKKEKRGPPAEERITQTDVMGLLKAAGFSKVRGSTLNESHYRISAIKKAGKWNLR